MDEQENEGTPQKDDEQESGVPVRSREEKDFERVLRVNKTEEDHGADQRSAAGGTGESQADGRSQEEAGVDIAGLYSAVKRVYKSCKTTTAPVVGLSRKLRIGFQIIGLAVAASDDKGDGTSPDEFVVLVVEPDIPGPGIVKDEPG